MNITCPPLAIRTCAPSYSERFIGVSSSGYCSIVDIWFVYQFSITRERKEII